MEGGYRFLALLRADLQERLRSRRFWLLLIGLGGAAWWCFPAASASYMILGVGGVYRGQYSSAWIGMTLAMLCIWLSLLGFYMVRGTLARDIDTRVWQLLVATPMRRSTYLLAKWCSHVLVLSLVLFGAAAVGIVAQLVRAEDSGLDLIELLKPLLLLGLPSLGMTAMYALMFDLLPWLRRSAGNAIYLVLWVAMLAGTQQSLHGIARGGSGADWIGDPFGVSVFDRTAHERLATQYAVVAEPGFCLACGMTKKRPQLLTWGSWQVSSREVAGRAFWLATALAVVLLMAPLLDWAGAHAGPKARGTASGGRRLRWLDGILRPLRSSAFGNLLALELQLTLRQRKLWWWLALLVAWVVQLLASPRLAALALVATWVLTLDLYAREGLREQGNGTGAVVFGASGAPRRVLLARWLMLLLVGALSCLPVLLRFCVSNTPLVLATVAVTLSMASWGLALGALTRNARAFELLVCALAYLAIDGMPALNVSVAPIQTASIHLASLPLSALILWRFWPGMRHR